MLNRKKTEFIPAPVIEIPLGERDRAFLRMLKTVAGGRLQLVTLDHKRSAKACEKSGYVSIDTGGRFSIVTITTRGQIYLDRLRGAH